MIKESTERRIFYVYQTGNLERERLNRFSVDRLRLPVLLEDIMPRGVYPRTEWHISRIKNKFEKGHQGLREKNGMFGIHNFGNKNPNWKGGKYKKDGYIFILKPKHPFCNSIGYIREHRFVVEQQINRHLEPKEIVHHLGKRDDNRPCMLMAFITKVVHIKFECNGYVKIEEIIFDGRKLKRRYYGNKNQT